LTKIYGMEEAVKIGSSSRTRSANRSSSRTRRADRSSEDKEQQ
jgi:hypothetical protein